MIGSQYHACYMTMLDIAIILYVGLYQHIRNFMYMSTQTWVSQLDLGYLIQSTKVP